MRHRKRNRRLGRTTSHKRAMMRNMVTSLLDHGRIVTTVPRAKELRRIADKMVTLAKDGSIHARRQALSYVRDRKVVSKLFDEQVSAFADRKGGYTRIVRIGPRRGDGAMMSVVELVTQSLGKPGRKRGAPPVKEAMEADVIPAARPVPEEPESKEEEAVRVSEATEGEVEEEIREEEATSAEEKEDNESEDASLGVEEEKEEGNNKEKE